MPVWPALLLAPMMALGEQLIAYALSTPACQTQLDLWMHLVPLAFASVTAVFTALAWLQMRRLALLPHVDADTASHRRYFVARIATWCGALSTLAIVAMWIPQWMLSPCAA